jgi:hypothetical protein
MRTRGRVQFEVFIQTFPSSPPLLLLSIYNIPYPFASFLQAFDAINTDDEEEIAGGSGGSSRSGSSRSGSSNTAADDDGIVGGSGGSSGEDRDVSYGTWFKKYKHKNKDYLFTADDISVNEWRKARFDKIRAQDAAWTADPRNKEEVDKVKAMFDGEDTNAHNAYVLRDVMNLQPCTCSLCVL